MINFNQPPPLSLYIHIPWCVRKCPYCDFNSHEARQSIPEQQYVDALIRDLEQSVPQVWGRRAHSIFFGGGTPSLFSAEAIDKILSNVRALLPLEYEAEITLEANPGTVEAARFAGFRDAGVNRLSLGIQSFDDAHLKALGRIHDAREAHRAVELALTTFDNVNLDLMYALPGQTPEQALTDLRAALGYAPEHLSAYHLTIEPNTPFHRTPPALPDDDTSAAMQEMLEQELAAHGYGHYETSAFAQKIPCTLDTPSSLMGESLRGGRWGEGEQSSIDPSPPPSPTRGEGAKGRRCRHNLNYWQFGDYLGIGAGAHGKLSLHDKVIRQARPKHPNAYLKAVEAGNGAEQEWEVSRQDIGFEFMMNALRLTGGFPVALFQERTGLPISVVNEALNQAEARGLLTRDHLEIKPTLQGQRFLNELLQLFLPES